MTIEVRDESKEYLIYVEVVEADGREDQDLDSLADMLAAAAEDRFQQDERNWDDD